MKEDWAWQTTKIALETKRIIVPTNPNPAVTRPTIESSQKPFSMVSLTILQARIGTKNGFEMIAYEQSMLKNFMAFNLDLSVISGSILTLSTDIFVNVVCITDSSLNTMGRTEQLKKLGKRLMCYLDQFKPEAESLRRNHIDTQRRSRNHQRGFLSFKSLDSVILANKSFVCLPGQAV
jgi:hypothetical protein